MHFENKTANPAHVNSKNSLGKANIVVAKSLPAAAVIQLRESITPIEKTIEFGKQNVTNKRSGIRNTSEEQKNKHTITATVENILYQRKAIEQDEENLTALQGKFTLQQRKIGSTHQLKSKHEEMQLKSNDNIEPFKPIKQKENNTGLPNNLKAGIENLSGFSMDDVKVHYNSDKPVQLNAHAYAQGTDIHIAPSQEKHLPHEAWHVVQQKQGRVKATMQMKGIAVNDDKGLEREADVMGNTAQNANTVERKKISGANYQNLHPAQQVAQRRIGFEFETSSWKAWVKKDAKEQAGKKEESINVYAGTSGRKHINEKLVGTEALYKVAPKKYLLHTGTNFKVETDGPYEDGWMSVEFITEPFEESDNGLKELAKTLQEMNKLRQNIDAKSGTERGISNPLTPAEHKLNSNEIYLSVNLVADGNARFKMQVTHGVDLQNLPTFLTYFGKGAHTETKQQQNRREVSRLLMTKGNEKDELSKQVFSETGAAPGASEIAFAELSKHVIIEKSDEAKLKGFLSLLIMYINHLSHLTDEGIKLSLPFMLRTPFNNILEKLHPNTKKILSENVRHFKNALIAAGIRDINASLLGNVRQVKVRDHPKFFELIKALTIDKWITGIMVENKDYLSKNNFLSQFEGENLELANQYKKSIEIFLRGHGDTKSVKPDPHAMDAIMENRGILSSPNIPDLLLNEAGNIAQQYLVFMKKLKESGGSAEKTGDFPKEAPSSGISGSTYLWIGAGIAIPLAAFLAYRYTNIF